MRIVGVIIMVMLLGACSSGEAYEGEWSNTDADVEETLTLTADTFKLSESGMSIEGDLEHVDGNRYLFKTETQGDLNLSMSVDDDETLHLYNADRDETEQYERVD